MSKIKHHEISRGLMHHEGGRGFIEEMSLALHDMVDQADSLGSYVDWGTLSIEPRDDISVTNAAGERKFYGTGLMIRVDSISIEDDE